MRYCALIAIALCLKMDGLREADWLDEREDPLELQRRPLEKEVVGWLNMQR